MFGGVEVSDKFNIFQHPAHSVRDGSAEHETQGYACPFGVHQ
jgi:hypothetical protein